MQQQQQQQQQQGNTDNMEEDKTHQRNESIYSMDSFVADFPPREGEKNNSPSPEKVTLRSHAYVSPSSSAATTPQALNNRNASFQDTIDSTSGFGNETPVPRQAPNPFFSPSYYNDDSEVSDGSFIIHETPLTPVAVKQQAQPLPTQPSQQLLPRQSQPLPKRATVAAGGADERDRFPSFDSIGSSSSIQYVHKPKPPSKPAPAPPPVNAPLTAEQIQRLPYHERRKLLAQRRQQQQQQSTSQLPSGPPPGMPQQQQQQLPQIQIQQQQQQQQLRNMSQQQQPPPVQMYPPQYVMPPPDMYGYPSSPIMMQQHPLHPGQTPYGRPPYQGVPPPPPPVGPPSGYGQGVPPPPPPMGPPSGYGNYPMPPQGMGYYPMPPPGYAVPPPPMQQQPPHRGSSPVQQQRGKEHLQTTGLPRGYTGAPREQQQVSSNNQSTIGRTRSSSFDSSDENKQGRRSAVPPPPPPPSSTHVRADSSGSISSFGSLDQSNHKDEDVDRRQEQDKSFLARLNPWAPKTPNVDDYHRKNQAFLKKANKDRQRGPSPSPKQEVRRVHLGSMDRPPPSRGTHKRLDSIDNDDWEEDEDGKKSMALKSDSRSAPHSVPRTYSSGEDSFGYEDGPRSQSRVPPRFKNRADIEADERSSLLPPPGISSNEQYDKVYMGQNSSSRMRPDNPEIYGSMTATLRTDNLAGGSRLAYDYEQSKKTRKKKKKSKSRSRRSRQEQTEESSDASYSSSSASSQDYQRWMKKRSRMLEKERSKLIKKWREEAKAEEEAVRLERENKQWYTRFRRYLDSEFGHVFEAAFKFLSWGEAFVANIPLTINAIALAVANLGVVWFKFAEENMESCEPVHYHSSQCSFPEFPGCFYCDTHARMYKLAVHFHWGCSIIAGILASLFICKLIIAPRVVFDELGSPTTAAPAGLFCMTLDIVFAGRGIVGQAFGKLLLLLPT